MPTFHRPLRTITRGCGIRALIASQRTICPCPVCIHPSSLGQLHISSHTRGRVPLLTCISFRLRLHMRPLIRFRFLTDSVIYYVADSYGPHFPTFPLSGFEFLCKAVSAHLRIYLVPSSLYPITCSDTWYPTRFAYLVPYPFAYLVPSRHSLVSPHPHTSHLRIRIPRISASAYLTSPRILASSHLLTYLAVLSSAHHFLLHCSPRSYLRNCSQSYPLGLTTILAPSRIDGGIFSPSISRGLYGIIDMKAKLQSGGAVIVEEGEDGISIEQFGAVRTCSTISRPACFAGITPVSPASNPKFNLAL
ncbi:hypothetical protein DEU56DRAFT_761917 [Suillus clintonianus]|uniref:uncharacterized protein n=1 Tax=Suillus clintonianus TaxID=1904413 RepID=UPI001B85E46C|nr:uncharacterized protein DEU56DRAFT_761917 [Suillus clintonianus]KAG2113711.1 hypothetical protein DEU56DRAFT_761917 [Suillus clintonianus]